MGGVNPRSGGEGRSPWTRASSGKNWWALQGSNLRHSACKADALPTELSARFDDRKGPFRREEREITELGLQSQLRQVMNNSPNFRDLSEPALSVSYHPPCPSCSSSHDALRAHLQRSSAPYPTRERPWSLHLRSLQGLTLSRTQAFSALRC